ncbi:MAG: hypothetical protein A2474_05410 [Elusimicrobia bacterium RIFOXYC2_FULL_34_12]|nr:MAG: hypothetical protein A2474_05410 [Elusimicrobia bacterium RIFOXYC2_FULL_34_12]OGS38008.1 MAG: hypothetical protein A2551_04930 [Elusimicrobia bacterium RIFOXYD2_FULL_34_30]HAM38688.1 NAD(P)-dependent oxidoreductase [Elusimicrobiota bacterium]
MKVLVTGGTGFLGSHLVEALLKKKYSVRCIIRNPNNLKWLNNLDCEIIRGDCVSKECLYNIASDVDYVFHLAGLVRAKKIEELVETNAVGTRNLVEAVFEKNKQIKKFVYISSQAAAGPSTNGKPKTESAEPNPVSEYGKSKLCGELEVLKFKDAMPIVILRPPAIYGPRDKDIFVFFEQVKKGFFFLPKKEKLINISYVSDICDGIIAAAESKQTNGEIYFIGDDTVYSWRKLGEVLTDVANPKTRMIRIPEFVFYVSALFSEVSALIKGKPALVSFDKLKEIKQNSWFFSADKAKKDFGYSPKISLEEGIKITYNWYLKNGWL